MKSSLIDELLGLKSKLENMEKEVYEISEQKPLEEQQQINDTDNTKRLEDKLEESLSTKDQVISLNIGGKIFLTKQATLLAHEGSLFHSIISKNTQENNEPLKELFFDRSPSYFSHVLNFLRTKKISYKKMNKFQREELKNEIEYYGLKELLPSKKNLDIEWDSVLSKQGMFTVNTDDHRIIRLHSTTCYTHFLTNRTFTDENFIIELESSVVQTDNYYYLGIINEQYNTTSNCGCCNPTNSYYIQCDGSTHINGVRTENTQMAWHSQPILITLKVNLSEKNIIFSIENKGELGPFPIMGRDFKVYAGHCNSGNGEIKINDCYEV